MFVYLVEIEWSNASNGMFRYGFHGYAENPSQANEKMTALIEAGKLEVPGQEEQPNYGARVVQIVEMGPVAFSV
jgi:hypothetical protein